MEHQVVEEASEVVEVLEDWWEGVEVLEIEAGKKLFKLIYQRNYVINIFKNMWIQLFSKSYWSHLYVVHFYMKQ